MTDMITETQDESTAEVTTLEDMSIAQLRAAAKFIGITAQRDWKASDFVEAIQAKQKQNTMTEYVFDNSNAPKPGMARVLIHRDPSPGHKNSPVPLAVNGRHVFVPRGIEVDIPLEYVEVLQNAKTIMKKEVESAGAFSPGGRFKDEATTSYPFQVTAFTPGGKFFSQLDNRKVAYERRKAFLDAFGKWPTEGELKEAIRAKIIKDLSK